MCKNSIMFSIRLPKNLYDDLKLISKNYPGVSMSSLIIFATFKDIQRFKGDFKTWQQVNQFQR